MPHTKEIRVFDLKLRPPLRPYVIVFGNEKGGTGKSTLAMHITIALLKDGYRVGTIDTDGRQGTFSRYIENRGQYVQQKQKDLVCPDHQRLYRAEQFSDQASNHQQDTDSLNNALKQMASHDFIIIDTPGNDTFLSRLAHSYADLLVTPLNDSFIDLDLLVKLDEAPHQMLRPSLYAEMVWDQRKERAGRDGQTIDWIVVRNRLGHLYTKNKEQISQILNTLAKRIGFQLGFGFGERVIFRELFLSGLTVLDIENTEDQMTLSHIAARQELRKLMGMIPHLGKKKVGSDQNEDISMLQQAS
eukprot:g8574.t1